jgi:hypothetical protein
LLRIKTRTYRIERILSYERKVKSQDLTPFQLLNKVQSQMYRALDCEYLEKSEFKTVYDLASEGNAILQV